jgi:tRNA(Ile2) C34 agmatinyltransferase TiaS
MEKDDFEPRISFSYARTKPLVVEKIKRRRVPPICPSCGGTMKLVRSKIEGKLTASCPRCDSAGD